MKIWQVNLFNTLTSQATNLQILSTKNRMCMNTKIVSALILSAFSIVQNTHLLPVSLIADKTHTGIIGGFTGKTQHNTTLREGHTLEFI
jgi:hypothetical protein